MRFTISTLFYQGDAASRLISFAVVTFAALLMGCGGRAQKPINAMSVNDIASITSLDPVQARELVSLVKGQGVELKLNRLSSITPEVARELAAHDNELQLNGLKSLSPTVAAEFARFKPNEKVADLQLDGVRELDINTATALAQCNHVISNEISEWPLVVSLMGLTSLTPDAATVLVRGTSGLRLHAKILTPDLVPVLTTNMKRYRGGGEYRALTILGAKNIPVAFKNAFDASHVSYREEITP